MSKKKHKKQEEAVKAAEVEVKEPEAPEAEPAAEAQEAAPEAPAEQPAAEEAAPEAAAEDVVVEEPEKAPEPFEPGRRVRELRRRQGFKKKHFAKLLGIKVAELEALESGESPLTVELAKAVDAACCVPWKILF